MYPFLNIIHAYLPKCLSCSILSYLYPYNIYPSFLYTFRVYILNCLHCTYGFLNTILFLISPTPTLMAFTKVTNAHGPSPQPTVCRSPSCSLTTATGSSRLKARFKPTSPEKSGVDGGANQVPTYLGQLLHL